MNEITIRAAKAEEVERIAEIEKLCFPAAEAAGSSDFMTLGLTTAAIQTNRFLETNYIMMRSSISRRGRSRRFLVWMYFRSISTEESAISL